MSNNDLAEKQHSETAECMRDQSSQGDRSATIHFKELPASRMDSPLRQEWDTYRREVGRLLAEGHEGEFVLIKNASIVGLFDTWRRARAEGLKRFSLQPMLIKQVLSREPILHARGYNLPCPSSLSP